MRGFPSGLDSKKKKICPQCLRPGVSSLGQEDSLEKRMVTHSSILAWRIPYTEKPSRLQSMGLQIVEHN